MLACCFFPFLCHSLGKKGRQIEHTKSVDQGRTRRKCLKMATGSISSGQPVNVSSSRLQVVGSRSDAAPCYANAAMPVSFLQADWSVLTLAGGCPAGDKDENTGAGSEHHKSVAVPCGSAAIAIQHLLCSGPCESCFRVLKIAEAPADGYQVGTYE